jgi:hypothetical protein
LSEKTKSYSRSCEVNHQCNNKDHRVKMLRPTYNTIQYNCNLILPSLQSSEVHTRRSRRYNYIAEQLWVKDLHKVPTQNNCLRWGSNPYSPRYMPSALTNRSPSPTIIRLIYHNSPSKSPRDTERKKYIRWAIELGGGATESYGYQTKQTQTYSIKVRKL